MPMMSNQPFNIPSIAEDLRRDETIHQIVDSLEYLDKIADEIFTRIHTRVANNQANLQKLNDRVSLAEAKISKISGSKKATNVFASAKYPAPDTTEFYETVFKPENKMKSPKRQSYHVQDKHKTVDESVLKEKLQYYHVKGGRKKKNDQNRGEGLGGLPREIPSVSALLLFNTSENPYKKYVIKDPLGVVTKTRTALEEEDSGMADAPNTIKTNEELQHLQADNYFYVPGIGDVPELDLPIALPNLLGVADDVTFSADQDSSIAPTVMGGNIPDLPSVVPTTEPLPAGPASEGGPPPPPSGPPPPEPPPPPPPSGAPPPPPPPPPPGPPPPGAPPPPPPSGAGAPPPPPPTDVPPVVSSGDGGRTSLMDAIRKAGGTKGAGLKNAKDKHDEKKKKKKEEKQSSGGASKGGGDLMGDLFAKLTMRRKGISGSGKTGDGGGGGGKSEGAGVGDAMDKISSMIPAPPKPAESSSPTGGDEEEDWE